MKTEIKQRMEQIKNGQVPEGYISTKAGVLPKWGCVRMNQIAEPITDKAGDGVYETLSISAGIGFVNQAKKFGKELSGKQYEKYTVLKRGDFSYNKGNSKAYPQGCIYRLKDRKTAAVPNVFESFTIKEGNPDYYEQLFAFGFLNKQLSTKINHGVRDDGLLNLNEKDFYSCYLPAPPIAEQKKIAEILSVHDKIIELQQKKIDELQKLKKAMLQRMFPKKGENVPEIRFPGFTDPWEQRKLGECFAERTERSADGELIAVTINFGVVKASELDRHDNSSEDKSNYKVVKINDIAYNSMRMWQGASGYSRYDGILSPAYTVLIPREEVSSRFFAYMFKCYDMIHEFEINSQGLTKDTWNLKYPALSPIHILMPRYEEQEKIANYLETLDTFVTLHQRKLEEYKTYKKSLMQLLLTGIVRVKI